jgi:glycosyltransferase involved in cell wall biosynthesis
MTIVHIMALGPIGGLFRVVEALALGQRLQGHDIHLIAVQDPGEEPHPMLASLAAAGVIVHPVVVPPRAYWRERREVGALCRQLRPHLVHTHGYRPDVVCAPAARALGLPIVTTVHGFTGGDWKNRFYEALQRRAFRGFDAVVAVSRHLADELGRAGVPSERIRMVPNAWSGSPAPLERVDARQALGITGERFQIGWVGRLSREKGPDTLVEALVRLGHLPSATSFLGDGPERLRLERITSASELAWRVRWHGAVPDAGRYITAFDLFVSSSRTEGMPIALFEAMAAGVPIIATGVGGVPEMLTAREALLIPPDDPEALALAVQAVYDDPHAAAVRARAARVRLLSEFAMDRCLERYEALYRELRPTYPALVTR